MKSISFISILISLMLSINLILTVNASEIPGYHFHTYFFQTNNNSRYEASVFRNRIEYEINNGALSGCRLNITYDFPVRPHPIGQFETCCNASAISRGISWFMQNHGNLSILLHPLTQWAVIDHTERAMFLGKSVPLDVNLLKWDLGRVFTCSPIPD